MARRQTYGERMAHWESESDFRDWERKLQAAINCQDQDEIEDLVKEGIYSEYSFASFLSTPSISSLLDQFRK